MTPHPREHVVRKQADIVADHAEDESVDEVRTTCGSCPRARNAWATDANDAAARSVSDCRGSPWVSPGRRRSGSENAHFSRSHVDASTRSSSSNSCVRLTLFVQLVRIRTAPCPTRSAGCITAARLGALACRERRPRPALGPAVTAGSRGPRGRVVRALPPPKSGKRRRRAKRFSRFRRVGFLPIPKLASGPAPP